MIINTGGRTAIVQGLSELLSRTKWIIVFYL